jgi:protein-tyrosine kinase
MSKIFEALECARREKRGPGKEPGVPLPGRRPSKTPTLDIEDEMVDLYHSIDSVLSHSSKKVIQFMGSREGEGTSTIVREFARVSAARFARTVLLIDADRRKPGQHLFSTTTPEYGLEEVIQKNMPLDGALHKIGEAANLYMSLLSAHSAPAAQIFNSAGIDRLLEGLLQRFDLILIDSPPAASSPDGPAFSQRVDGAVLVLEAEKTRWPVAESVKDRITGKGGRILGVVLNKRRYRIPEFIYKRL